MNGENRFQASVFFIYLLKKCAKSAQSDSRRSAGDARAFLIYIYIYILEMYGNFSFVMPDTQHLPMIHLDPILIRYSWKWHRKKPT